MNISLAKLPWYTQVGVFVFLAGAGVGAFYYYYEGPVRQDMAARGKQLASLRTDINIGYATAKRLPEFRAQVAVLEARLNNLKAVLPEEKDVADLLRRLQTVATQSNLTIKGFKPAPVVTKQLHAEWPIALQLDGTYHNLATFFDSVGRSTRIINIRGVDIKGKDKPDPKSTISATCVATTFVLLDKETIAKRAAAKTAKPGAKSAPPTPATPGAKGV